MDNAPAPNPDGLSKVLKNLFYGTFTVLSLAGLAYIGHKVYEEQTQRRSGKKHRRKRKSEGRKKADKSTGSSLSDLESDDDGKHNSHNKYQAVPEPEGVESNLGHKKRGSTLEQPPKTALSSKPGSQRTIKSSSLVDSGSSNSKGVTRSQEHQSKPISMRDNLVLILGDIRSRLTHESEKLKSENRRQRRVAKDNPNKYEQLMVKFQQDSEEQLEESILHVLTSIKMSRQEFEELFAAYGEDPDVKQASMLINTPEEPLYDPNRFRGFTPESIKEILEYHEQVNSKVKDMDASVNLCTIQAKMEDAVYEEFQIESEDILSYCAHNKIPIDLMDQIDNLKATTSALYRCEDLSDSMFKR